MASNPATMQRLKAAAATAAGRAVSAKERVRSAKGLLKQARKAFKLEKKAAKQARRKVDAAAAAFVQDRAVKAALSPKPTLRGATPNTGRNVVRKAGRNAVRNAAPGAASPVRPGAKTRTLKPKVPKPPDAMRSAAEVAKFVIERLHSPPPALAPAAIIPSDPLAAREPSTLAESQPRDTPASPDRDGAES